MREERLIKQMYLSGGIQSVVLSEDQGGKYRLTFVGKEINAVTGQKQSVEYGLQLKRSQDHRLFTEKAAFNWLREAGFREFKVELNPFAKGQASLL